jgi:hypothetical protein
LEFSPQILVLQNSLRFTFLPSHIFYNFLGILGFFPIISVTRISLFIFLNLEINIEWISFFFSFPAQPARPLLRPWPAGRPKPPRPPPNSPTHRPPSLPDRWALLAFVLLRLSSQAEPRLLPACAATTPEPPWLPPPLMQDPHLLPPLNHSHYPPESEL